MNEVLTLLGACAAGCALGVVTGLVPGVHVNTVLPFMGFFSGSGRVGAALIFSLAVTHTFLDFIPSTLFGVPDGDTALSVLPAHQLLLEGRGYEAVKLTVMGSLGALMVSGALVLPMVYCIPFLYNTVHPYIGYILLLVVGFIILSERSLKSIGWACIIFSISGAYGYIVLSNPLVAEDFILFPVFSGLFGLSTLLISLRGHSELPLQPLDSRIHLRPYQVVTNILKGAAAGIMVSLFPGVCPAHATAVMSVQSSPRQFLVAVSGVNTANAVYALIGLYTIGKARSGAVLAIQDLIHLDFPTVLSLLACGLVAAGVASITALCIAQILLKVIHSIRYKHLMGFTCSILIIFVWITTGCRGLLVMGVGCCIGLLPLLVGVRRSHCMGVLLFPVLLYYL